MTVNCNEVSTCSFSLQKEVCMFCQTRLKGADRELLDETWQGRGDAAEDSTFDRRGESPTDIVWTF